MKTKLLFVAAFTALAACSPEAADDLHVRALAKATSCCDALEKSIGGKVLYPKTKAYKSALTTFWSLQESSIHPTCIVQPASKEDVARAVKTLVAGDQKWPGQCQFAIRGGGHTPWAGAANIAKGITIDLSSLQATGLSKDQTIINISPGAQWQDVYETLDPLNLSTSGGRVAPVGVGGLTTGGGISFFSPRYGFVCNNVENFEVVLASGDIVDANSTSNPDLARALRGGSNNFGIVTSIDMKVFQQGEFWGGFIGYNISTYSQQSRLFQKFASDPDYDPYAALIHSVSISTAFPQWIIANNYEYTKSDPAEPYPKVFKGFTDLQPQIYNTMRVTNLTDLTQELAARSPNGLRELFQTATYKVNAELINDFYDVSNRTVYPLIAQNLTDFLFALSFQPLPPAITGKSPHLNSLGLSAKDGAIFNALVTVQWGDEEDDEKIKNAVNTVFSNIDAKAKQRGLTNKYLYLNYAEQYQSPIKGYGAASVARLQAASKKYDPNGVFQRQVPGGFKLP